MADLPALSESTKRILDLRSIGLLEAYRLNGDAVVRHARASEMSRRNALDEPPGRNSRYLKGWLASNQHAARMRDHSVSRICQGAV